MKNRYFKFFENYDHIWGYDIEKHEFTKERIWIPTDGGLINDPNTQYFDSPDHPYCGLYYCDLSSVLYYSTYGPYFAEVFPLKGIPVKISEDEGRVCYYSPMIRIGPIHKVTAKSYLQMIRYGAKLERDSPVFGYVWNHLDQYHHDSSYKELADYIIHMQYDRRPGAVLNYLAQHVLQTQKKTPYCDIMISLIQSMPDIGEKVFTIIPYIKQYYDASVSRVYRSEELREYFMLPVKWLLYKLYAQYPEVFAITICQFPEYDGCMEQWWNQHQFIAPDGFIHLNRIPCDRN